MITEKRLHANLLVRLDDHLEEFLNTVKYCQGTHT